MLNLQNSEQAVRVEQYLYKNVCVTAAFKCYCISMDKVITQLLGVWIYTSIYTKFGDLIQYILQKWIYINAHFI